MGGPKTGWLERRFHKPVSDVETFSRFESQPGQKEVAVLRCASEKTPGRERGRKQETSPPKTKTPGWSKVTRQVE